MVINVVDEFTKFLKEKNAFDRFNRAFYSDALFNDTKNELECLGGVNIKNLLINDKMNAVNCFDWFNEGDHDFWDGLDTSWCSKCRSFVGLELEYKENKKNAEGGDMSKVYFKSHSFKGELNVRHACYDARQDDLDAFIIHDKDKGTVMAIRRDLLSDITGWENSVNIIDSKFVCGDEKTENSGTITYAYVFKNVSASAIGEMPKFLKMRKKEMRKYVKTIKRTENEGSFTKIFTF